MPTASSPPISTTSLPPSTARARVAARQQWPRLLYVGWRPNAGTARTTRRRSSPSSSRSPNALHCSRVRKRRRTPFLSNRARRRISGHKRAMPLRPATLPGRPINSGSAASNRVYESAARPAAYRTIGDHTATPCDRAWNRLVRVDQGTHVSPKERSDSKPQEHVLVDKQLTMAIGRLHAQIRIATVLLFLAVLVAATAVSAAILLAASQGTSTAQNEVRLRHRVSLIAPSWSLQAVAAYR